MKATLRKLLKDNLSARQKAFLFQALEKFNVVFMVKKRFWAKANEGKKQKYLGQKHLRLHIGCNNTRLENFVNVDIRPTPATDMTSDMNVLPFREGSVDCLYSNAFFEHLYRSKHVAHLKSAWNCLDPGKGFICYTGIPYFKAIAKLYLEKGPGTAGPIFDLFNVYRYTHGDPDRVPDWYLEQLHKALFDEDELSSMLKQSGFANFAIFQYAFPGDANEVPVSVGFYATRKTKSKEELQRECLDFLRQFDGRYLIMKTLTFI